MKVWRGKGGGGGGKYFLTLDRRGSSKFCQWLIWGKGIKFLGKIVWLNRWIIRKEIRVNGRSTTCLRSTKNVMNTTNGLALVPYGKHNMVNYLKLMNCQNVKFNLNRTLWSELKPKRVHEISYPISKKIF